jgi:2-methylfumaryl-CoA hydratase
VSARSTVLEVKPSASGDKGVVHVRTALENQDGRLLCAFERKALIRAGKLEGRPADPAQATSAVPPLPKEPRLPAQLRELARVDGRFGFAGFFDDFSVGQTFAHGVGHTVGESEHMQLTTLVRNSHPLHFDELYSQESSFTGTRVVYGGLVFAWAAALASRDACGNALWELGYAGGAHPASVAAGDTLYAASRVTAVEQMGVMGGRVDFQLVGLKNLAAVAAVERYGDALFVPELGKDKEAKIAEKVFEIRRSVLVRAR